MGEKDELLEHFKQEIASKGADHLESILQGHLDRWKEVPLHIAVVGNVKSGKSSFINTIRGIKPTDVGAARVGVNEQTSECTRYNDPNNPNLVYWDIPGCGTKRFPIQSYLSDINADKYSFFLIVTGSAFTENDASLAEKLKVIKKPFYFVRTKIDIDIRNSEFDLASSFNERKVIESIRVALQNANKMFGYEKYPIFLISNRHPELYDFDVLCERIFANTSTLQREALVLSFPAISNNILKAKRDELERRIKLVALKAGAVSLIPFYGRIQVQTLLREEVSFYRQQFGLKIQSSSDDLVPNIGVEIAKTAAWSLGKYITLIGTALQAIYSAGSTKIYLQSKLKETYTEAVANMEHVVSKL